MRIRTIKPAFWTHPVLSREPDEVRLGAIGLLNYADDEGYFLASPALVRSAIWALDEDSTRARRVIEALARIEWIEVIEHPTHGAIGRVKNFAKHQVVNRPTPSAIKEYFAFTERSRSDHGTITEHSVPEGKGREKEGKGKGREGSGEASEPAVELKTPTPELVAAAVPVLGLTPEAVLADMLALWPDDWIRRALSVAVDGGKTGPPYLRGILQRWKANGKPDDENGAKHGRPESNQKHHRANGAYTAGAAAKFAGLG
jgi:hypothetical protein